MFWLRYGSAIFERKLDAEQGKVEEGLPDLEEWTNEQLFFLAFGNTWCGLVSGRPGGGPIGRGLWGRRRTPGSLGRHFDAERRNQLDRTTYTTDVNYRFDPPSELYVDQDPKSLELFIDQTWYCDDDGADRPYVFHPSPY